MDVFEKRRQQLKSGAVTQTAPSVSLQPTGTDVFSKRRAELAAQKPVEPAKPSPIPIAARENFSSGAAAPVITKTPLKQSRYNIVGSNIIPRYKEDKPLTAIGKDIVNYGAGTIGRIFNAPQQAIMQADRAAVNAITGKPQNFSQMNFARDIVGTNENNIAANIAGMALDPTTYLGGGILSDLSKAGAIGKGAKLGTAENLAINAARGQKAVKGAAPVAQTATKKYLNAERNAIKKDAIKTPEVIYASEKGNTTDSINRLALPEGKAKPTGQAMIEMVRQKVGIPDYPGAAGKAEAPNKIMPGKLSKRDLQPIKASSKDNNALISVSPQNVTQTVKRNVGTEPNIPAGQKERGMSTNTRTDINNPDNLRDSYTENPLTYTEISNPTTLTKAQKIFDQGYESARTQVSDLANKMQPEAVPLAKMLSRQAAEAGNIQGAREILSDVAEKLTQAGQFSQAARLLRESDPETFLMTVDKQLKRLNEDGLKEYGKKWSNIDLTPDELDMVSKIERGNQQSYESAFEQIQKRIADQLPSSATEKLNAWRHMSMLLNPKTHIRNVTGNAIMMGMRKTAQRVSGVAQKALLKQEDRTQAIFVNREYKQAAADYFEANKKDLLSGANKYNENLSLNMPDKRIFKNNAIEATRKFNYKLLELGDTPFFKNAYVDRLASYAQAKGIKDFSQLPQEAFDVAKKEAEQATYKDAALIANFLNKLKHPGKNANIGQKTASVITEAALPFTKTPINIIKRGIQYSPAGIVNGIHMWKSGKAAAAGIDEMAKGLTGTGILGLGYLLASKGVLTGKAENDKDLAEYNKNTGNSPFSILGRYTYDWAQPFAVPLTIGVEIYNAVKDSPEDTKKLDALIKNNDTNKLKEISVTFAKGLLDSFNASGDTVFNMSFMKGVRQLLGSGTQGVMEGLAQIPQNYAMQYIPTVLSQAAGQIDPIVRQTYYKGNVPESIKATLISKIPVASKTLQPKQTSWGEDVRRNENPFIRAFSQFLSPGIMTEKQGINPEVDAELRRLNKVGEVIQFPTMAANSFTWKGQKFDLTPEEYTKFQKTLGQNTLTAYASYIKTPEYKALNDSDKAKELSAIISDAKDLAKFQLIQSKGLAQSPEIMNVPESFTIRKNELPMTFEQQNEVANLINKYKKQYGLNKNLTPERVEQAARDRAYAEMKGNLLRNK